MNGVLQALVDAYQAASQDWLLEATTLGYQVFYRLAAIEIAVYGIVIALGARSTESILPRLAWKLFLLATLLTGLLIYPLWAPVLAPGFADAASEITGSGGISPSYVLSSGTNLALDLIGSAGTSSFLLPNFFGVFVTTTTALLVLAAFVTMAAILTKTLIESWLVLSAGPFFLGFSAFRLTAQIADNFFSYAIEVGIKFFFLVLLQSVAVNLIESWKQLLVNREYSLELAFTMVAGSALLAFVLWSIPTRIATVLSRNFHLGIRGGLTD